MRAMAMRILQFMNILKYHIRIGLSNDLESRHSIKRTKQNLNNINK